MSTTQTLVLGAIAGFTIFLGLPIGRMQNVTAGTKAFLASTATGILIFLFWDVMSGAVEPVEAALEDGRGGRFAWLAFLLVPLGVAWRVGASAGVPILWLLVSMGIWIGLGLVAGIPLVGLTWLSIGLAAASASWREPV